VIRIGFDGRSLASPAAGVRRYSHELFGALGDRDDVQVIAVGAPEGAPMPRGVRAVPGGPSLPTNPGWMLTGLPRAARRAALDLFHAPSYTAPLGGPRPLVLTIHDVSYERHPEWYPYRRDPLRRAFYRWSARTADRIITDSAFSKSEIIAAYGLVPDRIDVVPLAAAQVFSPTMFSPTTARSVSHARFILHVGDLHPRRNLAIAARALMRLRARRPDLGSVRFVLAGVDRGAADALAAVVKEAQGMLEIRGRTTEEELLALYRTASAVVYPSLYEGFGLPLLEAMACGTPVVAARTASIPEVTGDAALLVDPHDEAGWTDAIESALDPREADRLRVAGLARAREFTWRRTAEATLAVYRRALGARA
jgi:glycosyltransferase involved in cell wall biosynthesis